MKFSFCCLGMICICVFFSLFASGQEKSGNYKVNHDLKDSSKTKILILGTPHLATVKECLNPFSLELLLKILEKYKPDLIAVEKVPPQILEDMERRGGFYHKIIESFDKTRFVSGKQMQSELNISRSEAEKQARNILTNQLKLTDFQRVNLIRLLIAAFDYESAVLQWSYLVDKKKVIAGKIPENISQSLENSRHSANEIYSIGLELAYRFNLPNLVGIDDHFDEESLNQNVEVLLSEIKNNQEYKAVINSLFYKKINNSLKVGCQNGKKMLEHFQMLNSAKFGIKDFSLQWGLWLRTDLPSKLDRSRIAQWEMRNLNIASRIREATIFQPGKRILVIIGAGHKFILEKYLSQSIELKILQLSELTKKRVSK